MLVRKIPLDSVLSLVLFKDHPLKSLARVLPTPLTKTRCIPINRKSAIHLLHKVHSSCSLHPTTVHQKTLLSHNGAVTPLLEANMQPIVCSLLTLAGYVSHRHWCSCLLSCWVVCAPQTILLPSKVQWSGCTLFFSLNSATAPLSCSRMVLAYRAFSTCQNR